MALRPPNPNIEHAPSGPIGEGDQRGLARKLQQFQDFICGIFPLGPQHLGKNSVGANQLQAGSVGSEELATSAKQLFVQLPAAATRRVAWGQVSAAGAKVNGEGFTVTKTAVGKYTITPSPKFESAPSFTANHATGGTWGFITSAERTTEKITVEVRNALGELKEEAFTFEAIG